MTTAALTSHISTVRAFAITVVILGELEVAARAASRLGLRRRLALQLLVVFVQDLLHLAALFVHLPVCKLACLSLKRPYQ